jgi:ATP-dependent helicase/DNAse subunit B
VGDGDIALQGSVDRVDEGPLGLEIIDYKTGKARASAEIQDGRAFQLPLYLAAVSRITGAQPAGMAYLRVPVEEELDRNDVVHSKPDMPAAFDVGDLVNTKLPARLARLSNAIQQGVFVHTPFTPLSKACAWCDFRVSCAVRDGVADERQRRMADEDQEELEHVYLPDRGAP